MVLTKTLRHFFNNAVSIKLCLHCSVFSDYLFNLIKHAMKRSPLKEILRGNRKLEDIKEERIVKDMCVQVSK